jgi:hypothetical protein
LRSGAPVLSAVPMEIGLGAVVNVSSRLAGRDEVLAPWRLIRPVELWKRSRAATVWSLVMRAKGYVQAAIVAGLAYGCCLTSPTLSAFVPGIGAAQAKGFYTRKRVNGRWVNGRFPKKHAQASGRRHAGWSAPEPQQVASLPPQPPRVERDTRSESRQASVTAPREERLVKLQQALEVRAQAIATAAAAEVTSSLRPIQTQMPTAARPEPRWVSFDFESGLKTTTFSSGAVVRESFDIGTLKGLAAPPPGNESLASARP